MESATCLSRTDDLTTEVVVLRGEVQELRRLVAELRCEAGYWKSRHADALKRNESLQEELAQTKAEIRKLNSRPFGRKSEKHAACERTDLLRQAEEQPKPRRRRGAQSGHNGHGRRDHSHLPAREAVIELPQDQRVCPRCGKPMREMTETEDSEQIEIEVEVYRRRLHRRLEIGVQNGPGARGNPRAWSACIATTTFFPRVASPRVASPENVCASGKRV